METFLQQLINGLSLGAIYALIALGYTMVYGVLRLINFAHGDVYMLGAFAGYFIANALKLDANPSVSPPWNWSTSGCTLAMTSSTQPGSSSMKSATAVTNAGSSLRITRAWLMPTKRWLARVKTRPIASMPSSTLRRTSSMRVMPQNLIRVLKGRLS